MYTLDTYVIVHGKKYTITNNGDYRMVLDCMSAMRDAELSEANRVLASLLIFYNEFNSQQDIYDNLDDLQELCEYINKFINGGEDTPSGATTSHPVIDWEKDSQLICSAVNKVAGYEIRAVEYLHWWTFLSLYMAVGDSTLSTVVGIRNKILRHKKLEKWEQEFRRDSPHYFVWKSTTVEEQEFDNKLKELWNN